MKLLPWLVTGVSLAALVVCRPADPSTTSASRPKPDEPAAKEGPPPRGARAAAPSYPFLEVKGKTKPVPSRKAVIAPVPLYRVVEVLVVPGQRVKKNQPLVKLDDAEAQADVRGKMAKLESGRVTVKEFHRLLPRMKDLWLSGAGTEAAYYTTKRDALKAEEDQRAAGAALELAKATLAQFVVAAGMDGAISWLDVHVGMVSKPGSAVWGEILDLSEIDVGCDLTLEQADRVTVGQTAEVRRMGSSDVGGVGKVVFVGMAADATTGLVPATVRLSNANEWLRCGAPVQVRFTEAIAVGGSASRK